jgi:hypothetical protein
MRQSDERLLSAKGVALRKKLAIRGLRVYLATTATATPVLVLRGNPRGPSWPAISFHLEEHGIEHAIIEAGKAWILVDDNPKVRQVIQDSNDQSRLSWKHFVMVPDVGFVNAGVRKRIEPRLLIGPISAASVIIGVALIPGLWQNSSSQVKEAVPEITCALDLDPGQLSDWIISSINSSTNKGSSEIVTQSKFGLLMLEIEQTIGSTQSLTGSIECQDGRNRKLHYRIDASANGRLVELGQKLDP